jgi:hypothetical protein
MDRIPCRATACVGTCLAFLFLVSTGLHAQWQHLPGPVPNVTAFASDSSGQRQYAVLDGSGLWQTLNGGEDWLPIQDRLPITPGGWIDDIEMGDADGDTIFVLKGDPARLMVTLDGGQNWQDRSPVDIEMMSCQAWRRDRRVWLCVGLSSFARSTDGGGSWTTSSIAAPLTGLGAWRLYQDPQDDSTLFVYGHYPQSAEDSTLALWRSTDLGQTWEQCHYATASFEHHAVGGILGLTRLVNGDYLLTAERASGMGHTGLMRSTNGGLLWQAEWWDINSLPNDFAPCWLLADAQQPGHVFLGDGTTDWDYDTGTSYGLYESVDDGATWQPCPVGLPQTFFQITHLWQTPTSGTLWLTIGNQGLYRLLNQGRIWMAVSLPDVGMWSVMAGWNGSLFVGDETRLLRLKTSDNSFREFDIPAPTDAVLLPVYSVADSVVVLGRFAGELGIYCERDTTWTWTTIPSYGWLAPVWQHDSLGFANTDDGTLRITWDWGHTWVQRTFPHPAGWTHGLALMPIRSAIYLHVSSPPSGNLFLRSTDGGVNWEDLHFAGDMLPVAPAVFESGTDLFVLADTIATDYVYRFWVYHSGTWERRSSLAIDGYAAQGCIDLGLMPGPEPLLLAVASYWDGVDSLWCSTDLGYTWTARVAAWPYGSSGVHFYQSTVCDSVTERFYVSTSAGVCYLNVSDLATPGPARFTPVESLALAVGPNPFNSTTRLRYSLPRAGRVQLELFDILGRHVRTLVDARASAGEHEFRFDAEGLASGLYFVRLASSGQQRTQKLVLLK